eukprot:g3350.t1
MSCCECARDLCVRLTSRTIVMRSGLRVQQAELLAEGGFSFVHVARAGRHRFAMKRILCQTREQEREARHEVAVHNELSHPSLLRLVDHCFVRRQGGHGRGAAVEAFLLYPLYARGTLRQHIDRRLATGSTPDVGELLRIFGGVCEALAVMHRHEPPWAHRDVKPENVLLSEDGTPVLMDFGSVTQAVVAVGSRREALMLQERAAEQSSMAYRAPELFDVPSDARLDARTDVWSLGCLLFAMCFGYSPFECSFGRDGTVRVSECSYLRVISEPGFPPREACVVSPEVCGAIHWLLHLDIGQRPHIDEIVKRVRDLRASVAP